jgi:hypothetical protein
LGAATRAILPVIGSPVSTPGPVRRVNSAAPGRGAPARPPTSRRRPVCPTLRHDDCAGRGPGRSAGRATVDLLGLLANGELSAFDGWHEDARAAPTLAGGPRCRRWPRPRSATSGCSRAPAGPRGARWSRR